MFNRLVSTVQNSLKHSCLILCAVLMPLTTWSSTEYFVSLTGDDSGDGLSEEATFASIQRGVNALAAGDTLTILPGEYFGTVRGDGIGGEGVRTRIRARIPGKTHPMQTVIQKVSVQFSMINRS